MQEEGWSYGEAQKATGVPKSTVYNYSKSFVITKKRRGRDTVLTTEEELCLKEKELEDKRIRRMEKQEEERTKKNLIRLEKERKRKLNIEKRFKNRRQKATKNKK